MEVRGTFITAQPASVWSVGKFRSHGYKVAVAIIIFIISLQFSIQFASYNNHFISLNNFIMPQTIPFGDARRINRSQDFAEGHIETTYSFIDAFNNSSTTSNDSSLLPACPLVPPKLVGRLKVLVNEVPSTLEEVEASLTYIKIGGSYSPPNCKAAHKVAIIIPYRDRPDHLRIFLYNLHPILSRQNIDYTIFIVEEVRTSYSYFYALFFITNNFIFYFRCQELNSTVQNCLMSVLKKH